MIVCTVLVVAMVLTWVFVSPWLAARTEAAAPPVAPQQVASGAIDGQAWTADAAALDRPDARVGTELAACLVVDTGTQTEVCLPQRARGNIEAVEVVPVGERGVLAVVTAPRVRRVEVTTTAATVSVITPFVDFREFELGFPLGFVVRELGSDESLVRIAAFDADDELREMLDCTDGVCDPEG